MKFRVTAIRAKPGPKQTKATAAGGAKPASIRKRRKGPHTDLPEDPIEEPMPLYEDDEYDQGFTPMDEGPIAVPQQAKQWPPARSSRAREKAPESQQSIVVESQLTSVSSLEEACYEALQAFREKVWFSCAHPLTSILTRVSGHRLDRSWKFTLMK